MKILLIGSNGTIGAAVQQRLIESGHNVIGANYQAGDHQVDLSDKASIAALFERVGRIDAVVSSAGQSQFGPLLGLNDADFALGLDNKLMGQVNLLRIGVPYLNDGGSITLTSGALAHSPMPGSAAISPVNAAVEGFVRAAALELPRGLRVNAASPVFVTETALAMGMDTSHTLSAATTAKTYLASVTGDMTGQVLDARAYA
ncbi:MAG: short chain dehydrogenase [Burkholderiales bacterium]|nr:short chain dehydrogenase [Burkholderiales bacterium]